ncbi:hypothetical protein GBO17_14215 [Mycobacterium avium subsp. hominissuis]|nr:hypothetical protein [Mycobacterium avium subsp. hominissuis]MBZ4569617.1 hypothetical protein [Mycobacterium avium subsp. hominissuis]MBZ4587945.1 hypothetical protein [Mycobacterium avium subsp. hominissuis]MBZ4625453.1 hypothetical protein [Mycobacterium avium subsp. hominissuis]
MNVPHVVFVCRYNRGRSPIAAIVFAEQLRRRGLGDAVRVTSAGTCPTPGTGLDPLAAQVLIRHGYRVPEHRATQLDDDHLGADLVVALGYEHVGLLQRRGVDDDRIRYVEVRNPCRRADFEVAFDRISAAIAALHAWVDERLTLGRLGGEFWRWWKVGPDCVLASPIGSYRWETRDFEALCPHTTPDGCWCGVYAFTSAADCCAHIRATRMFAPELLNPSEFPGVVLGRVQLSDDAFLVKAGLAATRRGGPQRGNPVRSASPEWKASACRITRLYVDDNEADASRRSLSGRYGVPVHSVGEIGHASR